MDHQVRRQDMVFRLSGRLAAVLGLVLLFSLLGVVVVVGYGSTTTGMSIVTPLGEDVSGLDRASTPGGSTDAAQDWRLPLEAEERRIEGPIVKVDALVADEFVASLVQTIDTSLFTPPCPDPTGITYLDSTNTLLIADSEVDETVLWAGINLFEITLSGSVVTTTTTASYATEPTGLGDNSNDGHLFISDDDLFRIFEVDPGLDGVHGTGDDSVSWFSTSTFGAWDVHGVEYAEVLDLLFVVHWTGADIFAMAPGDDGVFNGVSPDGDDEIVGQFDTASLGLIRPEAVAFNPENGLLYLVGVPTNKIFVVTTDGVLVRLIDISAANAVRPAGLTFAPSSLDAGVTSIYISDWGVDNDDDPDENDGKVYEMTLPVSTPDLSMVKSVQPLAARQGELITYTLSFLNEGDGVASGVTITDHLPVSITVQSVISSGVRVTNTNALSDYVWEVEDLAPMEGGVITITGELSPSLECWSSFTNTAVITETNGDLDPGNNLTEVGVVVGGGVTISPAAAAGSANPGTDVFYTLSVTNTGYCIDTFALEISGNAWTVQAPASVGPLAEGASTQVAITVTVPSEAQCGDDVATITLTSQDGVTSDAAVLTTTANAIRGLAVAPSSADDAGDPGESVLYTLRVTNTGNCVDSFGVAAGGNAWSVTAPLTTGLLGPGLGTDVGITVTVSPEALCEEVDTATITFTSEGDGVSSDSSTLTTTANTVRAVSIEPSSISDSGDPGEGVGYILWVTNTGNCTDGFKRSVSDNAWLVGAPPNVGPLEPGDSSEVEVTVSVPADAQCGDADSATVTFTSWAEPTASDSSAITTSANTIRALSVEPASDSASVDPGNDVTYTLHVTNTGNCVDDFEVEVTGSIWPVDAPLSTGSLIPGGSTDVDVTVTVPASAQCGDDVTTVTFTSLDETTSAASVLTTTANPIRSLSVSPDTAAAAGNPGDELIYTLWVTNTGNCMDTFDLSTSGYDWPTAASHSTLSLGAGVSTSVGITVTVPLEALCGDEDSTTVTVTSQNDGEASASSTLTSSANTVRAVTVEPGTSVVSADPGTEAVHELLVTNAGNCVDTFDLEVAGYIWTTEAQSVVVGPLAARASATVPVTVTIPAGAQCTDDDGATVTMTSQNDGAAADYSDLTTIANAVPSVVIVPASQTLSGNPGEEVVHTLWLFNEGNCADTFDLDVSGATWSSVAQTPVGPLDADDWTTVGVTVTVPTGALCGEEDTAIVTASSGWDATTTDVSTLTTSAKTVRAVTVEPAASLVPADPGTEAVHELLVTNAGNCVDTFDLEVTGFTWTTEAQSVVGPLDAGASVSVPVTVSVPADAQCTDADTATVAVTSYSDGSISDVSTLTTSANAVRAVTVEPVTSLVSADPGTEAVHELLVTNASNCVDTFDLEVTGYAWATEAQTVVGPLDAGASASVPVTVTVPLEVLCEEEDIATVTVTSQNDSGASDGSTLTTAANAVRAVTIEPSPSLMAGDPGTEAVHELLVTNAGNCVDTFDLEVTGFTWATEAQSVVGPLGASASATVPVTVTVPADAQYTDTDTATVTVTSQSDVSISDVSTLTTAASAVRAVTVEPVTSLVSGDPGTEAVHELLVTNTGNSVDTFDLEVAGYAWATEAQTVVGPLAAGVSASVPVTVTVPLEALCEEDDSATVTVTSQNDSEASDSSTLTTAANAVRVVTIEPAASLVSSDPGTEAVHELLVTNAGNCVDTFDLEVTGFTWATEAQSVVGPLDIGASVGVPVTVTVPADAQHTETDTATVTVISQNDVSISDVSTLTTAVNAVRAVTVEPVTSLVSGDPGTEAVHELLVTNTGNSVDTFDLEVTGYAWATEAQTVVGPLDASASVTVLVTVTVPLEALCEVEDIATVTVTSQNDSEASDGSTLTTAANAVRVVTIEPATSLVSSDPGAEAVHELLVTNAGNCVDTFDLEVTGFTWATEAQSVLVGPLDASASATVPVTVTVPADAQHTDTDTATVTVISQNDVSISDVSTLTTAVNAVRAVTVEPVTSLVSGDPGMEAVHELLVTNTGNSVDTFDLEVTGYLWATEAQTVVGPLDAGASVSVLVTVTVPLEALCGVEDIATVTVTSQNDSEASESSTLTTAANVVRAVTIEPATSLVSSGPGTEAVHELLVTNAGNCVDTFDLEVTGYTWATEAESVVVGPLDAGASVSVLVTVTIPADAQYTDTDTATVTVISQNDDSVSDSSTLTTSSRLGYCVYLPIVLRNLR